MRRNRQGICETLDKLDTKRDNKPEIYTTYLEPLGIYGLDFNWGVEHFGQCGGASTLLIDHADGTPGSNVANVHSTSYDLGQARLALAPRIPPHQWPPLYYTAHIHACKAANKPVTSSPAECHSPGFQEVVGLTPALP